MSNPGDNSHNRKLKELLDKAGQPEQVPADDFEKEALEGFAMLGNEEAMDLKQDLDARLYNTVFKQERSKRPYWLAAAAGLVLIIGFSVYFTRTNLADTEPKEVAIIAPPKEKEPVPSNMMAPPPPPVPVNEKAEEPAPKTMARARSKADMESVTTNLPEEKPAAQSLTTNDLTTFDKEETFISSGVTLSSPEFPPPPIDVAVANFESDKSLKEKEEEKIVVAKKEKKEVDFARRQNEVQYTPTQINVSGAASPQWSSNSLPAPAATMTCNIQPVFVLCTYTGGDAALQKEVKEKLGAKNLAQKFDAVLYINRSNVVEKVKLTKTYALTQQQQQEVITLLRSLTKFTVDSSVKKPVAYTLNFRP